MHTQMQSNHGPNKERLRRILIAAAAIVTGAGVWWLAVSGSPHAPSAAQALAFHTDSAPPWKTYGNGAILKEGVRGNSDSGPQRYLRFGARQNADAGFSRRIMFASVRDSDEMELDIVTRHALTSGSMRILIECMDSSAANDEHTYGDLANFEFTQTGNSDGWIKAPIRIRLPRGTDAVVIHFQLHGSGYFDVAEVIAVAGTPVSGASH